MRTKLNWMLKLKYSFFYNCKGNPDKSIRSICSTSRVVPRNRAIVPGTRRRFALMRIRIFFTALPVPSGAKAFTFARKKIRLRRRHFTHCRATERKQKTANFRLDTTTVVGTSNDTVHFTVPYCSKIASIQ